MRISMDQPLTRVMADNRYTLNSRAGYAVNLPLSASRGDVEAMAMYAGQGVGAIDTVEPAAAIIERFAATLRPA